MFYILFSSMYPLTWNVHLLYHFYIYLKILLFILSSR